MQLEVAYRCSRNLKYICSPAEQRTLRHFGSIRPAELMPRAGHQWLTLRVADRRRCRTVGGPCSGGIDRLEFEFTDPQPLFDPLTPRSTEWPKNPRSVPTWQSPQSVCGPTAAPRPMPCRPDTSVRLVCAALASAVQQRPQPQFSRPKLIEICQLLQCLGSVPRSIG